MITYLQRLTNERDSLTESATSLADTAAREERDLTDTERASLHSWQERCAQIDEQLTEYNAQAESARSYARLREELATREAEPTPSVPSRPSSALETRSWGDTFVESDAFRGYTGKGTSGIVEIPFPLEERAAITVGGLPPGMLPPFVFTPPQFTYASPVLDVVGKVTTSSNAVQWIQWDPNPQAMASVVPEEALKPEADMTPSVVGDSLDTIAHWKGITRQALEDIPQIRSTVEGRLRQGIIVALESAVASAIQAAPIPPVTGSAAGGDTLLGVIRQGIAEVQMNGYANPNAVLLNPADWAAIDIGIMGGTLGGPTINGSFWGIRPVAVASIPAGTAYVGDFSQAATLFSRGNVEVFMTDSHADYFIRNVLVLLAEIRALATVPEPQAAAKCTVGALAAQEA
jgi:capsid protein